MGFHIVHKATSSAPGRLSDQLAQGGAVLVEFSERDAPTCRLEEPILSALLRRYADRLRVLQVDVESSPHDAAAHAIEAVPTFVLFVAGEEKARLVGFQTGAELSAALDKNLPPVTG